MNEKGKFDEEVEQDGMLLKSVLLLVFVVRKTTQEYLILNFEFIITV